MTDVESHLVLNDLPLLDAMLEDANRASPIYLPGPYWASKSQSAVKEIKKCGVSSFRGYGSVGTSYADNAYIDCRGMFDYGKTKIITFALRNMYPLKNIFDAQVALTKSYYDQMIALRGRVALHSRGLSDLLAKYVMPFSIGAGCVDAFKYEGGLISNHYVQL